MKDYKEVAQNVLQRRDEYHVKMAKRRKQIRNSLATFCCLSVVTIGGIAVWQNELQEPTENSPEYGNLNCGGAELSSESGCEDLLIGGAPVENDGAAPEGGEPLEGGGFEESTEEHIYTAVPEGEAKEDIIVINELESISSDRQNICLLVDDFVAMNKEQLTAYYGIDVFPEYPDDLKAWDEESNYGIYKREKGTGEVYWDGIVINYSNEDFSRNLNVEVEKGNLPFTCIADFSKIEEISVINGIEVGLGKNENGYYFAEMIYEGVGFRIIAQGLSEEEVVSVVKSLIK